MNSSILKHSLVCQWGGGEWVLYASKNALWVVNGGRWDEAVEVGAWVSDEIVELSVSCKGYYLMVRGLESCVVIDLPDSGVLEDFTRQLPSSTLYTEEYGVTSAQWHPLLDEYLYCLHDNRTIAIYNTLAGELYGVVPLPSQGPTISMTLVTNPSPQNTFSIVTGGENGVVDLHCPVVPPGACLPQGFDLYSISEPMLNEVKNKLKQPETDGSLAIDPSELDEGKVDVAFCYELCKVSGPVMGLWGEEINGVVYVVVMVEEGVKVLEVEGEGAKEVGEVVLGEKYGLNTGIDKARFGFGGGVGAVLCNHPLGIVKIDFFTKHQPPTLKVIRRNQTPQLHLTSSTLTLGVAFFSDLHPEQHFASILATNSAMSVVIDHIPTDEVVMKNVITASKPPQPTATPISWKKWITDTKSTLPQDTKNTLVELVTKLRGVQTDLGVEDVDGVLKVEGEVVRKMESVAGLLQQKVRQKLAEYEEMRRELEQTKREMQALSSSPAMLQRLTTLKKKITSGNYTHPASVTSAVTATLNPYVKYLPVVCLEPSIGALRAHLHAADLTSTPVYESHAGKDCFVLESHKESTTSVVVFEDGVKLEVPPSVLVPSGGRVSQCQRWEESMKLADEREAASVRAAEDTIEETNNQLRQSHSELLRAVHLTA